MVSINGVVLDSHGLTIGRLLLVLFFSFFFLVCVGEHCKLQVCLLLINFLIEVLFFEMKYLLRF
jgi:hypothetical protein